MKRSRLTTILNDLILTGREDNKTKRHESSEHVRFSSPAVLFIQWKMENSQLQCFLHVLIFNLFNLKHFVANCVEAPRSQ